jgi:hypothetical protein
LPLVDDVNPRRRAGSAVIAWDQRRGGAVSGVMKADLWAMDDPYPKAMELTATAA